MDKTGDTGDKFGRRSIDSRPTPLGCCSLLTNGGTKLQYEPQDN